MRCYFPLLTKEQSEVLLDEDLVYILHGATKPEVLDDCVQYSISFFKKAPEAKVVRVRVFCRAGVGLCFTQSFAPAETFPTISSYLTATLAVHGLTFGNELRPYEPLHPLLAAHAFGKRDVLQDWAALNSADHTTFEARWSDLVAFRRRIGARPRTSDQFAQDCDDVTCVQKDLCFACFFFFFSIFLSSFVCEPCISCL